MIYKCTGSTGIFAPRTVLTIIGTATGTRPRLLSYTASNVGVISTDANWQLIGRFFTVSGTATVSIPAKTDPSDPPALFTAGENLTAEPTYTIGNWETVGINPRGIHRWVAVDPRDEIIIPAVAENGIGFTVLVLGGAATPHVIATVQQ